MLVSVAMMTPTRFVVAVSLALALGAATSAAAADKEQRQMMADLRMLQEQAQQLQNLLGSLQASLNEALKTANAANAQIDKRLDEQTNATRKALADQKLVVDNISSDLRVVREKVDDSNVRVGSLTQEVDALRQLVQLANAAPRAAASDGADAAAAGGPPPDAAAPASPPSGAATIGESPQKLWDTSFADYTQAHYDLAVLGFDAYIKEFPKSDKAADAQVYIGNSYLNAGQNEKAVAAYDQAILTYPSANALPEAYYKKGLALQNLKQLDAAREAYEAVVKKYPESSAATLANQANQRLQELVKKP